MPHIREDRRFVAPLLALISLALAGPPSALAQEASADARAAGTQQQMTDDERFSLLPQPRSIDDSDGWLPVNGGFQVEWLGYRNTVLDRVGSRFQNDVARRTGPDLGRSNSAQLRIDCRGEDQGI